MRAILLLMNHIGVAAIRDAVDRARSSGPHAWGPAMWADGIMVVSLVRQGFFDKPRETARAFGHISVVWEMSLLSRTRGGTAVHVGTA